MIVTRIDPVPRVSVIIRGTVADAVVAVGMRTAAPMRNVGVSTVGVHADVFMDHDTVSAWFDSGIGSFDPGTISWFRVH